jgi:hypothetical protein
VSLSCVTSTVCGDGGPVDESRQRDYPCGPVLLWVAAFYGGLSGRPFMAACLGGLLWRLVWAFESKGLPALGAFALTGR